MATDTVRREREIAAIIEPEIAEHYRVGASISEAVPIDTAKRWHTAIEKARAIIQLVKSE